MFAYVQKAISQRIHFLHLRQVVLLLLQHPKPHGFVSFLYGVSGAVGFPISSDY